MSADKQTIIRERQVIGKENHNKTTNLGIALQGRPKTTSTLAPGNIQGVGATDSV